MAMTLQAVVALDASRFTTGLTGMQAATAQFAGAALSMFGGVATEISSMYSAFGATGAAVAGMKSVIGVGATYEQYMAAVASVTGMATDEIAALGEAGAAAATRLGIPLAKVGASLETLARTGINTARGLNDMLIPALLLAGSQNADTATSTETLAATLQAFQLPLSDATAAANLFAGALAASPMDMDRLKDSMKMASPAAAALGMSMQDMIGEVATFHTVGLHGAQAGTTFRGALLECDKAARAATGPVGAALSGWTAASEGLTGAVRRLNAAGVPTGVVMEQFGKRAGPGMALLMRLGGDAIDDVKNRMISLADVQKMYDIQMNTTQGRIKIFKAGVEELANRLFATLAPAMKSVIEMAEALSNIVSDLGDTFGFLGGAVASVLPVLIGTAGLLWGLNKILMVIPGVQMGLTGLFAGAAESWAPTAAAMTAMATKTMPMFQSASMVMTGSTTTMMNGFQKLKPELYSSANKMDLMTGAVTRHNRVAYEAATATNGFFGTLTKLQGGILMVVAGFAGWKIGSWLADMKMGEFTLSGWIARMYEIATGIADADSDLVVYTENIRRNNKAHEENKAALAAAAEAQRQKTADMIAAARAADIELEKAMAVLRANKEEADAKERVAAAALVAQEAYAELSQAITVTKEDQEAATAAMDSVVAAHGAVVEAVNANLEADKDAAAALEKYLQAERDATDASTAYHSAKMGVHDMSVSMADATEEEREELRRLNDATEKNAAAQAALTEAKNLLAEKNGRVADTTNRVVAAENSLQEATSNSRDIIDKSITTFNTITKLVDYYAMGFDEAREAVGRFGDGAVEVANRANQLKISMEEASKRALWFGENGSMAGQIIRERMGGAIEDVDAFLLMFGEHFLDVAAYMKEFGVSAVEAGTKLGFIGGAVKKAAEDMDPAVETMAKLGEETLKFGRHLANMNPKKLDEIKNALLGFYDDFKDKTLDLKWLTDLSNLRIPHLNQTAVGNFIIQFNRLAEELKEPPNILVDWIGKLGGIKVPHLNQTAVGNFIIQFNRLATQLNGNGPDLSWVDKLKSLASLNIEDLKKVMKVLEDLPTGTYNASVLIGWRDNETLSSIDTSLKTLAEMRGVVWA